MSEMSKKARAENRTKATRLTSAANGSDAKGVDASSWKPSEPLNADRKTGARPIRARIYKHGGAIQGDRAPRVDRTPRASGGALTVHNTAKENKDKLGSYHVGGYKKGGRTKRDMGGMADPREAAAANMASAGARSGVPQGRFNVASQGKSPFLRTGGSAKAKRLCAGGGMAGGGEVPDDPYRNVLGPGEGGEPRGTRAGRSRMGAMVQKPKSKPWPAGARTPTPPKEERSERKAGGRAKGKTNINIIIGKGGSDGPPQLPPQGVVRPPPAPPVIPPAMPPSGPPPGGPPMGLAGPGMPPPGGPPMARKSGGRTGHRTYRSYKDMDAGSGSGLGRLEEAEIAAHKR